MASSSPSPRVERGPGGEVKATQSQPSLVPSTPPFAVQSPYIDVWFFGEISMSHRTGLLAAALITLLIALLVGSALAQEPDGIATYNINMRTGPGPHYAGITLLPVGTGITLNPAASIPPGCWAAQPTARSAAGFPRSTSATMMASARPACRSAPRLSAARPRSPRPFRSPPRRNSPCPSPAREPAP